MKSAWAWTQRPETLISILPLSEGPPVRTRPPCSTTKLVGRWQVAESCGHWAFLGHKRQRKNWNIFLSVKQWSKLSSQGQHYSSSPYRQKHLIWPAALCLDPYISLLWGAVTLLSSPELVFTPLTFRGGGGGRRQDWWWGACQGEERLWPWIN